MFSQETTAYLELLSTSGTCSDLHRFKRLLGLLGNPQEQLRCIHLAGTNGKGSVASFVCTILKEAGYKVGLYTSPDLVHVTERIRIGNELIPEKDFERLLRYIQKETEYFAPQTLFTYFEILTALSFLYYAENHCDMIVLETGLGGRNDATNVISSPLCTVLTPISYDHVDRLGCTLREIAYEKAGIIKASCPTVSCQQPAEALEVITATCKAQNSSLYLCDTQSLHIVSNTLEGQVFHYKHYEGLTIRLLGMHQCYNAALAIDVIEVLMALGLSIDQEVIYKGLEKTKWPGRLEIIHHNPLFLIDGAHNAQGAKALQEAITHYFKGKKIIYLFGSLKDKDRTQILELTMPLAHSVVLVTPPSSRALSTDLLQKEVKVYCEAVFEAVTLAEGTQLAFSLADEHSIIIAFGSLYFIGEIPLLLR